MEINQLRHKGPENLVNRITPELTIPRRAFSIRARGVKMHNLIVSLRSWGNYREMSLTQARDLSTEHCPLSLQEAALLSRATRDAVELGQGTVWPTHDGWTFVGHGENLELFRGRPGQLTIHKETSMIPSS